MEHNQSLLPVEEAARLLGVSVSWMNKKRLEGGGCPYIKVGRRVLYSPNDIYSWVETRRRISTSQEKHALSQ